MKPNAFVTKPLYEQVRDTLEANISDGTWKPGGPIPNEVDLARDYGVSVGTMRKALGALEEDGLLIRRQGRGSFVADQRSGVLKERLDRVFGSDGRPPEYDVRQIASKKRNATAEEQKRLRLQPDDKVVIFSQIVRVNQTPAIYREAHVPQKLIGSDAEGITWDVLSSVKQYGLWVGAGFERLHLEEAETHVAAALGVEAKTRLLVLDRLVHTLDGKPLEWLKSWSEMSDMYYEVSLA